MRYWNVRTQGRFKEVECVFDCENGSRAIVGESFDFTYYKRLRNKLFHIKRMIEYEIECFCKRNNKKELA